MVPRFLTVFDRLLTKACLVTVTVFALSGIGSTGSLQAQAGTPDNLDSFVEQSMKKYNVPGVAMAIVEKDKVDIRCYGVRTVGKSDPVDENTLFMIASNTKPFTAALLGILVDKNKLAWDDAVIDNLPEFALYEPYSTRMCTARDLLAHRSGLPAFGGNNLEALGFSRQEILRRIRYIEPSYSFREEAGYSNPAYFAAGMLASRAFGAPYESLIKEHLFKPLQMNNSGLSHHDKETYKNTADAHRLLPDGQSIIVPWDDHDPMAPAGAITSTALDMSHWVQMWLNQGRFENKQVLSPNTVKEMFKPAMVETPTFAEMAPIDDQCGFSYGLGWGIYYYQGHKVMEKGGARTGMRSVVILVPDKKLGVVVLANQNLTVIPEAIRAYILEKMVAPSEKDLQAEIEKANQSVVKLFTKPKSTDISSAPASMPLANYVGTYENKLYGPVSVTLDDKNKLWWQAGPLHVKGPLAPIGHDVFQLSWPGERISLPEEITFTLSKEGVPTKLTTESFGTLTRVKNQATQP